MMISGGRCVVAALCFLALAVPGASHAQWKSVSVPAGDSHDLLELSDGRLLVRWRNTELLLEPGTNRVRMPPATHEFVQVIDGSGQAQPAVGIPGFGDALAAFRKGFVGWRRNQKALEVHSFEVDDGQLRTSLLYSSPDANYAHLSTSPDADALYVNESLSRGGARLTRIDTSGAVWSRSIQHISGAVALADGVAFLQSQPVPNSENMGLLTRLGGDGELMWSVPASMGASGVPLVLRQGGDAIAVAAANSQQDMEIASYAAETGELLFRKTVPDFARAIGTSDGVLLLNMVLYRPYLAFIGPDGTMRWWRRFMQSEAAGMPTAALLLRSGELALLTTYQAGLDERADSKVLFVGRDAKVLSDVAGDCTRLDPLPLLQSEKLLAAGYAINVSLDYGAMYPHGPGCPRPTEAEYAAALQAIQNEFVQHGDVRNRWEEGVDVHLMANGPAKQLVLYHMGMSSSHSAERRLSFEVRVDEAAEFAGYLRKVVFPHMARVQQSRTRFRELTGQTFAALMPSGTPTDPDVFFTGMERAIETLEQTVQAMDSRQFPNREYAHRLVLFPDRFGVLGVDEHPIKEAGQTLLRAIAEGQREWEERMRKRESSRRVQ